MFINEHVTKINEELAYMARKFKKEGKITSIWTMLCVYLQTFEAALFLEEKKMKMRDF